MTTESQPLPGAAEDDRVARGVVDGYRGDIDGLRAIAILLVVAFHAGVPFFGGGFIGVDVFFVISGYLITSKLVSEAQRTGRIRLIEFWANRVRRLVPALALMVAVVLVASVFVFPRVDWSELAVAGAAASLYVSNILYARSAEDYFATDIDESPFLHTWSLGVEEQFYLLWPLVVGVSVLLFARFVARKDGQEASARRTVWMGTFAAVLVTSFLLNLVLSRQGSAWAFFGLPTRAWEFAAAGLLAVSPVPRLLRAAGIRWVLVLGGFGLLAASCVLLDGVTGYPGRWALLPVVATAAILMAGDPAHGAPTPPTRLLALAPAQWIGRVSYSWYLWHWPAIILVVTAVGSDRVALRVAAAVCALPVAVLSHRYVENPLRYSAALRASRRKTYLIGAGATAAILVVAGGVIAFRAVTSNELEEKLVAAREERRQYSCDEETSPSGLSYCVSGDLDSSTTVMMVGDSHARHWKQAMGSAAELEGVRLVDTYRGSCPPLEVELTQEIESAVPDCQRYNEETRALIDEIQPNVVILSHSTAYASRVRGPRGQEVPRETALELWGTAYRDLIVGLTDKGITVAVMRPGPVLPEDPLDCIADEGAVEPCETARKEAMAQVAGLRRVEDEVLAELPAMPTFDVADAVCDQSRCHLMADDIIIFSDRGHLTVDFTMSQRDALRDLIRDSLEG